MTLVTFSLSITIFSVDRPENRKLFLCVLLTLPQSRTYAPLPVIYSADHLNVYGILTGRAERVFWGDPTAIPQEMKTNVR